MSMKKRVICLFSLIMYLLTACTALSLKIEEEMMTRVEVSQRSNRGDGFSLSQRALFTDDGGQYLYEITEGTSWNSGLRIRELKGWSLGERNAVHFFGTKEDYSFVVSASRNPREDEEIAVVEEFTTGTDRYLYLYPDGVPEDFILPKNSRILTQNDNALLLELNEAEFPFFQHSALQLTDSTALAARAWSLTDVSHFFEELPTLVLVFALLFAGILFWALAILFSSLGIANRFLVRLNGILSALSLPGMILLLNGIDLPASMLPADQIFNRQHYACELSLLLSGLEALKIPDVQSLKAGAAGQCRDLFLWCGCTFLMLILAEIAMHRIFTRTKALNAK